MAALTNEEILELLRQVKDGGGYDLPERPDGSGVDPADLEAAKTGMVPSRAMSFDGGDSIVQGSAEPGSMSTPEPDPTTPSPREPVVGTPMSRQAEPPDEIANLLAQLQSGQNKDRRQAYNDRGWALARMAGGAVSTQMGHLPQVREGIPGIPKQGDAVAEQIKMSELLKQGKASRQKVASGIQMNDQKLDVGAYKLEDLGDQHDPNSRASRLAQNAAADALEQSGQDPSIVYHMSATDIAGSNPQMKLIVSQAINQATQKAQDERSRQQRNTSMRNTDVMARGQLAGRVLGASTSAGTNEGNKDFDDAKQQEMMEIPGLTRIKRIAPAAYKKASELMADHEALVAVEKKILDEMTAGPRPIPGTQHYDEVANDFKHAQSIGQRLQLGGVMRDSDMTWMKAQTGDPSDLWQWVKGNGAAIIQRDMQNQHLTTKNKVKAYGYEWGDSPAAPSTSRGDFGGGSSSGPLQDPNVLEDLQRNVITGSKPPVLSRPGRGPQSRPAPQPGVSVSPPKKEANLERLLRLQGGQ